MCRRIAHLRLHADKVARQQKIQNLPASVAQGLEAERPAIQQGVQRRVGLALVDQGGAGTHLQLAAFQPLHRFELFFAVGKELGQGA